MSMPEFPCAVPFVVAVSGHRDLHPDDVQDAGERVFAALRMVADALPHSALEFLTPLADGADQLFAAQVLRLRAASPAPERIRLLVPLPMPLDAYCAEQGGADRAGFEARIAPYLAAAADVFAIPHIELDAASEAALTPSNAPYARLARYLAIHAGVVVVVWDGRDEPVKPGGTLDLVNARTRGFRRGSDGASAARLAEPEQGCVLHVMSRRGSDTAAESPAGAPLMMLGGDFRVVGAEIDDLNRRHRAALAGGVADYAARVDRARAGFQRFPGAGALATAFGIADVLAEDAKRTWRRGWIAIALAAVLAASSSLLRLLDDEHGELIETASYGAGAVLAVGIYFWVARSGQRNAYLACRALAEGLRVQIYWMASGSSALVSDHYLLKQREDMGWVRRALDALTVRPALQGAAPAAVARAWIDDQLAYLEGPNIERRRVAQRRAEARGQWLLAGGLVCALAGLAVLAHGGMRTSLLMVMLIVAMKLLTDTGAAWLSFNGKMAHAETLRQAAHLRGVYQRADQELKAGADAAELLAALGKEVLDENANWLRLYLERQLSWHGK